MHALEDEDTRPSTTSFFSFCFELLRWSLKPKQLDIYMGCNDVGWECETANQNRRRDLPPTPNHTAHQPSLTTSIYQETAGTPHMTGWCPQPLIYPWPDKQKNLTCVNMPLASWPHKKPVEHESVVFYARHHSRIIEPKTTEGRTRTVRLGGRGGVSPCVSGERIRTHQSLH